MKRTGTELSLGSLKTAHLVVLTAGLTTLLFIRRKPARRIAVVAIFGALLSPGIALALAAPETVRLDSGTVIWRDEEVTVIEAGGAPLEDVLAELRRAGVTSAARIVLPRGSLTDWDRLQAIRQRVNIGQVWAPHDRTIPKVIVPAPDQTITIAGQSVSVQNNDGKLVLTTDGSLTSD